MGFKQIAADAVLGIVAGRIIDWVYSKIENRRRLRGEVLCDTEHFVNTEKLNFDFSKKAVIDGDTEEVLIDFSKEKNPGKEMVKVLKFLYS